MMDKVKIRLRGQFDVVSHTGRMITPGSKKAMGLLALLATSDTHKRTRRWLEDKLWSDRADEQARNSLRNLLTTLRKELEGHADILRSDRLSVWLVADRIETDLNDSDHTREFLEGIDIPDPNFNDWVMHKRMSLPRGRGANQRDVPLPTRVTIQCGEPWQVGSASNVKPQIVNDQIGKIITDFVAASRRTISETTADLVIRTSIEEEKDGAAILVQVIDPEKDVLIHSDHCFAEDLNGFLSDTEQLGRFCWNVADMALEKLPSMRPDESPLAQRSGFVQKALRKVLTFDPVEMKSSLMVLDTANDHMDAGLYLALKAWAITSLIMEGFQVEDASTLEEIASLLIRAEEVTPGDPMMAAVSANVNAILFQNHDAAIPLARRALRDNPNNLFALQALSVGRAAQGALVQAYDLSRHGMAISALSKFEAMCNLHHSLLCMSLQRTGEAMATSQVAADRAPAYRAPRRQLIGLHAAQDQQADTLRRLAELKTIETDFSLDRYLFDQTYPSNTLRKTGYLDLARRSLGDDK